MLAPWYSDSSAITSRRREVYVEGIEDGTEERDKTGEICQCWNVIRVDVMR